MRRSVFVLGVACVSLACGGARAAGRAAARGALAGVIREADTGAPIERTRVRLYVRGAWYQAATDSAGRYRIADVASTGEETAFVEAWHVGYYRDRREVQVRAGATDTLDFALRRSPPRVSR